MKGTCNIFFIVLCLAALACPGAASWAGADPLKIKTWACYYGTVFGPRVYGRFDLVVMDGYRHPPLPARNAHVKTLGYLSVGEVDRDGPFWQKVKNETFLIEENEAWESMIVDVRDPKWQALLLNEAIPQIFSRGFNGLFLDTFDSALYLLEMQTKNEFQGVDKALVSIVKAIKTKFPDKWIAVNRGLPVLPDIAPWIDFIIYEDLYSAYDHQSKTYYKISESDRKILMPFIKKGRAANPSLGLLSLDYAGADQPELAQEAICFAKKQGFIPYVSNVELDQIFLYTLNR